MQGTQRRMAFLLVNGSEMGNGRKGAFCEDRYHTTAGESGQLLLDVTISKRSLGKVSDAEAIRWIENLYD